MYLVLNALIFYLKFRYRMLLLSYKKALHIFEAKCGGLFPSFLFFFTLSYSFFAGQKGHPTSADGLRFVRLSLTL